MDRFLNFIADQGKQAVLVDQFLVITLAVIGIGFTLLTVLQSFIESKKSSMLSYSKAIKENTDREANPMIYEKEQVRLSNNYINRQKKFVSKLVFLILVSTFLFILNLYPKFDIVQSPLYYGIDIILYVLYILFLVFLVLAYINIYEQNVNNRNIWKAFVDNTIFAIAVFKGLFKKKDS